MSDEEVGGKCRSPLPVIEGKICVTSDFSDGSSRKRKRTERGSVPTSSSQDLSTYDTLISFLESFGEKMRRKLTRIERRLGIEEDNHYVQGDDGQNLDEVIDAFRDEESHGGVDKIDTLISLLESIQVEMLLMLTRIDRKLGAEEDNNGVQGDDGSDEENLDEVIDAFQDGSVDKRDTLMSLLDSFGEEIRQMLTRIEIKIGIEQDNNGVQGDGGYAENVDRGGEEGDDGVDEENLDEIIDAFQDEESRLRVDKGKAPCLD